MTVPQASVNQLEAEFRVTDSAFSALFRLFMLGFLAGAVFGGRLSDRFGKLPVIALGCVMMSVGMLISSQAHSFSVIPIAAMLAGAGGALAEVVSMALVSDLYHGAARTVMMNWTQLGFSAGAFIQPIVYARMLSVGVGWRSGYAAAGALGLVCVLLVAGASVADRRRARPAEQQAGLSWWAIIRDRFVLRLAVCLMLYVGAEIGLSSWVAAYMAKDLGSSAPVASASVAAFWIGIGVGRLVAVRLSRRLSDHTLICWSLGLGAALQAALLLMHLPQAALLVTFAAGVALGPAWPTIVSRASGAFPANTGAVIGIVAAFGCLGAAIFPSVVGQASDVIGLRYALWICVVALVIGLVIANAGWGEEPSRLAIDGELEPTGELVCVDD